MSKAAVAAAPAPGAEEAPKKGKKKLIIIGAAVAVLLAGGGAAFFVMNKKAHGNGEEAAHVEEKKGPPAFAPMDPFVVNLSEPDSDRFIQVGITFEVKDAKMAEQMKSYTPILRSRILLVLASKTASGLLTTEGKQQLMDELLELARDTVNGPGKDKGVVDVHFSSFVIQ